MTSGEILHTITIDDSGIKGILGPAITKKVVSKYVTLLNKLGTLCANAYKSKVPVDTFELRDKYVAVLKKATSADPTVNVGIVNATHYGRDKKPLPAPYLAIEILNLSKSKGGNPLLRTKTSDAVDPYSSIGRRTPTKGWIKAARLAFANSRRTYLSASRF